MCLAFSRYWTVLQGLPSFPQTQDNFQQAKLDEVMWNLLIIDKKAVWLKISRWSIPRWSIWQLTNRWWCYYRGWHLSWLRRQLWIQRIVWRVEVAVLKEELKPALALVVVGHPSEDREESGQREESLSRKQSPTIPMKAVRGHHGWSKDIQDRIQVISIQWWNWLQW